ncbi:DUF3048 domain-containing protein [Kribbella deserti]|uniref:DUF3048 domain-containing protein n=1 Tax=Kribbella deserti TaxID=1926257 RepID=A0ABV6QM57_9ACTN
MQRVGESPVAGGLRRAALSGMVLALAAAGCTSDSRTDGGPSFTSTASGPVVDGGVSMEGRAPLTGVPSKNALARPAITVKISNTRDAHPHRGLGEADLVFVEPIAGATTRLAAIYHSRLPDQVGPVRSLRPMDAALIGPTKGIIANTMADKWVLEYMDRSSGLENLGTLRVPSRTYRIDNRRRAPNHVFAQPTKLLALSEHTAPPAPYFAYAADAARSTAQLEGKKAAAVTVGYGGTSTTTWRYDARTRRWLRSEQWSPHRIENAGQVAADNVMVMKAERDTSFTQARGSMTILDLFDASGDLQLFTGNKVIAGRWTKGAISEPFKFTTTDGKPLLLTPGTTWVECASTQMPVKVS